MKNNQSNRLWKVSLLVIGFVHIQKKLNLFQRYSIKSIFFQKILTNFKKCSRIAYSSKNRTLETTYSRVENLFSGYSFT